MALSPDVEKLIADRTGDLAERENLSKVRQEAVELALRDMAERGEWPPPEDPDESELELAIKAAEKSAALADQLKGEIAAIRKGGSQGARAQLGQIVRGVSSGLVALCRNEVPGFGDLSKERQLKIREKLEAHVRRSVADALGV